jgi:hypothetical protein
MDAQDFQSLILILNAIDNRVGPAMDHQFACALHPAPADPTREYSETATTILASLCQVGGNVGTIRLKAANNIAEAFGGGRAHSGCGIF